MSELTVNKREEENWCLLELAGPLNHTHYPRLKEHLVDQSHSQKHLLLDLTNVTAISSIVIGSLYTQLQTLEAKQTKLFLLNCPQVVMLTFEYLSLADVFSFFSSVEEALEHVEES